MFRKAILYIAFLYYSLSSAIAQDSLSMLFVGDAMMHQTQINSTQRGNTFDLDGYYTHIESEIKAADIAVVNLEAPLAGEPYSGYPVFSSPDEFAISLQKSGFDLFLFANNHCLDKGTRGMVRTHAVLDSQGIKHIGTYLNPEDRKSSYPYLLRKNGFRIIMLNYTYGTNGFVVASPRIVNYIDKEIMAADIEEAKLFCPDFIIANIHWGVEYNQKPSGEQRELSEWLFRQGVDVVMGSHPHVVQPMEMKKDSVGVNRQLVVYSLGNFVSNMSIRHTRGGAMVKLVLCRKGLDRYIGSANYAILFNDRYTNDRGNMDMKIVPAVTWSKKDKRNSLLDDSILLQYINDTRTLLKDNNVGVDEYIFE